MVKEVRSIRESYLVRNLNSQMEEFEILKKREEEFDLRKIEEEKKLSRCKCGR